jgi:hypothetical protein
VKDVTKCRNFHWRQLVSPNSNLDFGKCGPKVVPGLPRYFPDNAASDRLTRLLQKAKRASFTAKFAAVVF